MSGVLKQLEDVRDTMRALGRELRSPNRSFDPGEVNRRVRERVDQKAGEANGKRRGTMTPG